MTEQSVKLIKNTVVYVKPDKNSAQLGSLEKGTKVKAVGKTEKDEWLMVNYNGRVAYIKSNSIDRDELSSVEETVEEDSRGHRGTANGNNSNTNSGGTGSTVKKPSNTNSGNGTITPTKPDTPVTPTKPDTPITPTEPDAPVTPTEPETSVTPTEPDKPVTPPTESDNSSESEESLDGE